MRKRIACVLLSLVLLVGLGSSALAMPSFDGEWVVPDVGWGFVQISSDAVPLAFTVWEDRDFSVITLFYDRDFTVWATPIADPVLEMNVPNPIGPRLMVQHGMQLSLGYGVNADTREGSWMSNANRRVFDGTPTNLHEHRIVAGQSPSGSVDLTFGVNFFPDPWNTAYVAFARYGLNQGINFTRVDDVSQIPDNATPIQPPTPTEQPSSWARSYVDRARELGVLPEAFQSGFRNATTRAEFAELAVTLYEHYQGPITGRETFTDTDNSYVERAAYIGVVNGVGNNRFDPNASLTREQAAVMISRLALALGQPLPAAAPTFADNAEISSWAINAVGEVQASGIMTGVGDNRFSPRGPYTREQSVITVIRLHDILS